MEKAVFGGGCFWCTEAIFQQLKGVERVVSGYAGGNTENPTYENVHKGGGHAEVIEVTFDPGVITYRDLLTVFFGTHDPTTPNRQGADIGEAYRSIILYTSEAQRETAEAFIQELQQDAVDVVTEVQSLEKFYPAESEHQNFYKENAGTGYCQIVIEPKIEKLREKFAELTQGDV